MTDPPYGASRDAAPRREGHLSCCARVDSVCWTVLIRCEFYALDYTLVYVRSIRGHSLSIAFGLSVILRTFAFLAFDSLSLCDLGLSPLAVRRMLAGIARQIMRGEQCVSQALHWDAQANADAVCCMYLLRNC